MIQARVAHGQLEFEDPIPQEWEGQRVNIVACASDDPIPDLEEHLAAFHALGPVEEEPGEKEEIAAAHTTGRQL